MRSPAVLILAAGQGKRMKSDRAKVLHEICGVPMVHYAVENAKEISDAKPFVVIGHQAEAVKAALGDRVSYVEQLEQKGTGHAVLQAEKVLRGKYTEVIILCGDTPLLSADTLHALLETRRANQAGCCVLTVNAEDPSGYGRIVRCTSDSSLVESIVEHKDATKAQLAIKEINSGVYCFEVEGLYQILPTLTTANAQHEYYLTDVVRLMGERGMQSVAYLAADAEEALGVNDRKQLAKVSTLIRQRLLEGLMLEGVTIEDPQSTFIDAGVSIGQDTIVKPFTFLQGNTTIGKACVVGPQTTIKDSRIGDFVSVTASIVEQSCVHSNVEIGPYAHLRPGNEVCSFAKIGNYAELKNTVVGERSKISHHCYAGDSVIGSGVNFSAGVITGNYDGVFKHRTIIEDGAFVGCNVNLIAPIKVGEKAYIAAGSTINKDVPKNSLAIAREYQVNKEGWVLEKQREQQKQP